MVLLNLLTKSPCKPKPCRVLPGGRRPALIVGGVAPIRRVWLTCASRKFFTEMCNNDTNSERMTARAGQPRSVLPMRKYRPKFKAQG